MAKSKFIEIQCSEQMKDIICLSLRNFACIAYPKTENSECNLVASDALRNAADEFEKSFAENGCGFLNRRLRRIVQTAIEAHYTIVADIQKCNTRYQCELMLKVCRGDYVLQDNLDDAIKRDQQNYASD